MNTGRYGFLLLLSISMLAQDNQRFEIASVEIVHENTPRTQRVTRTEGNRFVAKSATLMRLITQAYDVQNIQVRVVSGPNFLNDVLVDVDAKLPEGAKSEQVSAMLQALLRERFGLITHFEKQSFNGYRLSVVNQDLLQKAKAGDTNASPQMPTDLDTHPASLLRGITLGQVAQPLSQILQGPVDVPKEIRDLGPYNLWVEVGSREDAIFSLKRHGLKVDPVKSIGQVLVIEKINRIPTDN